MTATDPFNLYLRDGYSNSTSMKTNQRIQADDALNRTRSSAIKPRAVTMQHAESTGNLRGEAEYNNVGGGGVEGKKMFYTGGVLCIVMIVLLVILPLLIVHLTGGLS